MLAELSRTLANETGTETTKRVAERQHSARARPPRCRRRAPALGYVVETTVSAVTFGVPSSLLSVLTKPEYKRGKGDGLIITAEITSDVAIVVISFSGTSFTRRLRRTK